MKTFARIENGVVYEVVAAKKLPPFHSDLTWVEVSDETPVAEDYLYDGVSFIAPEPPGPPDDTPTMKEKVDALIAADSGDRDALESIKLRVDLGRINA